MTDRIQTVTMPKWGMTMTDGRIAAWLKQPGDRIEAGEEFVEIETEKITNVVEAQVSGTLRRVLVQEGQSAPCGSVIAILAEADVPEAEIDAIAAAAPEMAVVEAAMEEARINAGGLMLNVVSAGTGEAAPLILLHGFASDAASWMFVQGPLAEARRVHAIDLPSHGASGVDPGVASVDALALHLARVIDAVAPGRLHLAGHSLGGRLAARLAADLGDRVRSVTLIAPAGLGQGVDTGFVAGFLAADKRRPMKEALQLLVADPGAITPEMVERALASKRIDGAGQALAAIAEASLGVGQAHGATDDLARVTAPVLVLWGAEDRVIAAPASGAEIMAGAGHIPQMEAASAVAERMVAFLEDAE